MNLSRSNRAQTLAVALSTILVWVVSLFGVEVPAPVALAFTVVLTFLVGGLVRDQK